MRLEPAVKIVLKETSWFPQSSIADSHLSNAANLRRQGISVISTSSEFCELSAKLGEHCIIAEVDQFERAIAQLRFEPSSVQYDRIEAAKALVQEQYDWRVIVDRIVIALAILR